MAREYSVNSKVLGAPLMFNDLSDPGGVAYQETFLRNQSIVSIVPGRPVFKIGKLAREKWEILKTHLAPDDDKDSDTAGLFRSKGKNKRTMPDNYYADENEDSKTVSAERDLRFYSFGTNFREYRKILNVLLNEVVSKTSGMSVGTDISKYVNLVDIYSEGIHFWAEPNSSVSMSGSNEISDSMLSSLTSAVSAKMKELSFITGQATRDIKDVDTSTSVLGGQEAEGGFLSNTLAMLQGAGTKIAGAFGDSASAVVSGENLLFPKIFKDSKFNPAVNLQFKFHSPYNDPASICEFVYVPFLSLLAFCLPIQKNPTSFSSPFLVRVQSPGWFNISMGMVSNFSFTIGGSEQMFNNNGLPRVIDFTMSITDMYPTMTLASDYAVLNGAIGLSTFLDCMAGLSLMRANVREEVAAIITHRISTVFGLQGAVSFAAGDFWTKLTDTVFGYN